MTSFDPKELPRIPELEDEYELVQELGRGGTSIVYLARDRELRRDVAIKLMRPEYTQDEEAAARLVREAHTVSRLQHPNIVMLLGTRRLEGSGLALILQFVPGRTLKDEVREHGALPLARAERILGEVGGALAHAHRQRIVHRDVKPENVYLDEGAGIARLADFGIARPWDSDSGLTLPGSAIGTPTYMSPEQVEGGDLDGRSDIYSLGLVAWEMITGRQPWAGESLYGIIYKQKYEDLPDLREVRPEVPPSLAYAVRKALQKDRNDRWKNADAFVTALAVPASRPVEGWTPPEEEGEEAEWAASPHAEWDGDPRPRSFRTGALLLVLLLSAAAAAVGWGLNGEVRSLLGQLLPAGELPRSSPEAGSVAFSPDAPPAGNPPASWDPGAGARPLPPILRPSAGDSETGGDDPTGGLSLGESEPAPQAELDEELSLLPGPSPDPEVQREPDPAPELPEAENLLPPAPADPPAGPELGPAPAVADEPAMPATSAFLTVRHTLVTGGTHSCQLEGSGALTCWGGNREGQLGSPGAGRAGGAVRVDGESFARVSTGFSHSCALSTQGRAYCWGANDDGQLGDGSTLGRTDPGPVASAARFVEIEAGLSHTCALTVGGSIYCWGSNSDGQLGDGTRTSTPIPVQVQSSTTFSSLTVGWRHSCALDGQGRAYCWGTDRSGEIGRSGAGPLLAPVRVPSGESFRQLSAGSSHTCGLTTGGQLHCWGANEHGQLGIGEAEAMAGPRPVAGERSFIAVSAGAMHTCALTSAGTAYCWGRNVFGQLGDGSLTDRDLPVEVAGGHEFSSLHAFGSHSCGTTRSGELLCWGNNMEGQLGDGTLEHRTVPVRIASRGG